MKRIPQLDGIRGVAVLMVLVWHYFSCQVQAVEGTWLKEFDKIFNSTWSGVNLFFALSGFLITGILLDHRGSTNFFKVFYARRAFRIFPLYFAFLLMFVAAQKVLPRLFDLPNETYGYLFGGPMPLWSYATFTQNIFMGRWESFGCGWLGITWSLAVEEQFYILMPLFIYFLPRHIVFYLFASSMIISPLMRSMWPGLQAFVCLPWRADSLLAGACLAYLVRTPGFMEAAQKRAMIISMAFGVLLYGAIVMTYRPQTFGVFNHSWLALLHVSFILVAVVSPNGWISWGLQSRVLIWFGTLSYGIYMFHQTVNAFLHGLILGKYPGLTTSAAAWVTGLALVATLVLAMISYRFFEEPLLRLGHRFRYEHQPPAEELGLPEVAKAA